MLWNKNFYKIVALIIFIFITANSCSNEDTQSIAVQKSIHEIINDWHYYGFETYYNDYDPSDNILDSINMRFNPEIHKYILFTSPSCFSCGEMDSLLPQIAKILDSSELPDTGYVLFDTPGITSSHPYEGMIFLEELPSAYLLNSDTKDIYSVLDTFHFRKSKSINTSLEIIMLEFLK